MAPLISPHTNIPSKHKNRTIQEDKNASFIRSPLSLVFATPIIHLPLCHLEFGNVNCASSRAPRRHLRDNANPNMFLRPDMAL